MENMIFIQHLRDLIKAKLSQTIYVTPVKIEDKQPKETF